MEHYICKGGCKGASDKPGVCQAETCPKKGKPLLECNCGDGGHYGAFDAREKKDRSMPPSLAQ